MLLKTVFKNRITLNSIHPGKPDIEVSEVAGIRRVNKGRAKLGSVFILCYILLLNTSYEFVAGEVSVEDRDVTPKTSKYSTNRFTIAN